MSMGMIGRTKASWRRFRAGKPGHRFQDRYHHRQQKRGHLAKRIFLICLGVVLAVGSLFLAPLPGPGFATVFLGLAILAGEVRPAARFLDWAEVRTRELVRWVRGVWRSSAAGKVLVLSVAAGCVGAVVYVAYRLLFGG
jgi:uncharacterized protein (TIGR02611 family)